MILLRPLKVKVMKYQKYCCDPQFVCVAGGVSLSYLDSTYTVPQFLTFMLLVIKPKQNDAKNTLKKIKK